MRADNSRHLTTAGPAASRTDPRPRGARAAAPRRDRQIDHLRGRRLRGRRLPVLALLSTRHSSRDPSPANAPTTVARGTTDPPATASHRGIPAAQARSDVPADAPPRGRQPPTATGPSRSPRLGTHSPVSYTHLRAH